MKKIRIFVFNVIGIAITMLLFSCGRAPTNSPIVEFVSDQGIVFLDPGALLMSAAGQDGRFVLYLSEPALLQILMDESDVEAAYLYRPEDGDRVEIRIDGDILYANGIARSVSVDPEEPRNFASWFETADEAALKSLRTVSFKGESAGAFETNQCKKIMAVNPHVVGCWDPAKKELEREEMAEHAPLVVFIDTSTNRPFSQEFQESIGFSEAVILMTDGIDKATIKLLKDKGMPKLRRLHLTDSEGANELFDAFPHVKAVNITCEVDEMPNLDNFTDLEELHVSLNYSPTVDFGRLLRPDRLHALTINMTTNVTGLEKLVNLEYLNPGETTFSDADLEALLEHYANLLFLDLSQAEVESLEPLRNHRKLEVVELGDFTTEAEPDFSPLGDLPKLRFIAMNDNLYKSGATSAIREVCPQVVIYQHDKFCLGSGWLLLFPFLLLIMLLVKRIRAKTRRRV